MTLATLLRLALCVVVVVVTPSAQTQSVAVGELGPQQGTRVPEFSGTDQWGRVQTLDSIVGPQGAMLVLFRSADW